MSPAEEVLAAARAMHARGLVTGAAGNVSARDGADMIITPTRRYYDEIDVGDLVRIPLGGDLNFAMLAWASQEWLMHVLVYVRRPDVGGVVHTHSPYATARSFNPTPLNFLTEDGPYLGIDWIDVAANAERGTPELARLAVAALGEQAACLLARHGVLAVGNRPRAALEVAAAVEHQSQIHKLLAPVREREPKSTTPLTIIKRS